MHVVQVDYSPEIVRAGIRRFWFRFAGRDALLGLAGMAASLAAWRVLGRHWLVLLALGVFGALFAISIAVFFAQRHRSMGRLRKMGRPTAIWRFSEESIAVESDLGETRLRWSAIEKAWRFPELWILSFSRHDYSILPAGNLSADLRAYIAARIEASGGTVR